VIIALIKRVHVNLVFGLNIYMWSVLLIDTLLNAHVHNQESLQDLNNFVQTFKKNIALLESLHIPDPDSFILFSIAFRCMSLMTRKLFESLSTSTYPTVTKLLEFTQSRISILENVGDSRKSAVAGKAHKSIPQQLLSFKAPQPKNRILHPLSYLRPR
jgi:hypothetical protein